MEELKLGKTNTALVVIDLQKGIAAMGRQLAPHSVQEVVGNAARLADAFRRNGMPVFLVHVVVSERDRLDVIADDQSWGGMQVPPDWAEFVPELSPRENDVVITKKQWGAFYGTELELQLRRRGIGTIVLCGISTNHGVESTARFAYEYGFQQVFAEDAMSSMSADMHNMALNIAFKRIGRVRSTDEILSAIR